MIKDEDIVSTSRESLEKFIRELHRVTTYVKILGDSLNIMFLTNRQFIQMAESIFDPRMMFISRNDGLCNGDMLPTRDILINANSLKSLCRYTHEEIDLIERVRQMD